MDTLRLLIQEIRYRKINFALSLLAIAISAAVFVSAPTLVDGYRTETTSMLNRMEDETRKLMLKMGFNLMIVHQDTNMADLWASDYAARDMPEEYVARLATSENLTLVTHLVATLQQRLKWNDRTVLLVGYLPEVTQTHMKKKKPMGYALEPGSVYLGFELRRGSDGSPYQAGDTIRLAGHEFTVAKILPEKGSKQDITIAMNLADAQRVLDKPGAINQIMALGCRCQGERLPQIRAQLEDALPETKITEFESIAVARAEQRDMISQRAGQVHGMLATLADRGVPGILLVCGVWVGLLALLNVRERRYEIGLLRALGKSSTRIAGLFLGKAFLVGLVGGVIGALVGMWLAQSMSRPLAALLSDETITGSTAAFRPATNILLAAVLGAPILSILASYLPTLSAIVQNPAVVLRDH